MAIVASFVRNNKLYLALGRAVAFSNKNQVIVEIALDNQTFQTSVVGSPIAQWCKASYVYYDLKYMEVL